MRSFINAGTHVLGIIFIGVAFYIALSGISVQPVYYVLHYPSGALIILILVGILFASDGITKTLNLFSTLIFKSPNKLEAELNLVQKSLKEMCEAFYASGASGLKQKMQGKKIPRVWNIIFNQLESKILSEDIRLLLEYDSKNNEEVMNQYIQALQVLSALAPSAGVLGTVIGLIKLLGNLKDFSSLGSNMSLALITTLYGVFFGTIVFRPLISRLENVKQMELQSYEQAIFWIYLTEQRKPGFYLEPKYFDSRPDKTKK